MTMPSTTAELIAAAAEALVARDMLRLEDLLHHARNWLQPEAEAAAQEAWEEAGVQGAVDPYPVGSFAYKKVVKGGIPVSCRCSVYRIEVEKLAKDYPEKGQRILAWMSPKEAAKAVDEPELQEILKRLA